MKTPEFWQKSGHLYSRLLWPLSQGYRLGSILRQKTVKPYHATVPVLCVGNVVAGGAGKTPVVAHLAELLKAHGSKPHIVSRGYGGSIKEATLVSSFHQASEVGDEPLLLTRHAPCWVGSNRRASIEKAVAAGASVILMDDGFQNPAIYKDMSLLVINGQYGLGNQHILPAGPLRESLAQACRRARAIIMIGKDETQLIHQLPRSITLFRAQMQQILPEAIQGKRVVAFAGIAHPEKFFSMLKMQSVEVCETIPFADHHIFCKTELVVLIEKAARHQAELVCTEKDWVRLNAAWQQRITPIPLSFSIMPDTTLLGLLEELFKKSC